MQTIIAITLISGGVNCFYEGYTGATGVRGETGATGITGATGATGATGLAVEGAKRRAARATPQGCPGSLGF